MEEKVLEKFMKEVFDLAESETGSEVRNRLVNHIHRKLIEIFDMKKVGNNDKHFSMSYKTIERYHKKFIDKQEYVSGYSPPKDEYKFQLARFLGYENFESWKAHIYKNENLKNETFIGGVITKIDRVNGDVNIK